MKNIILVGINHKTAPVEIREKFFCSELQQKLLLSELRSEPSIVEALVLSTCNRVEIFAHVLDTQKDPHVLITKLFHIKKLKLTEKLKSPFYIHEGEKALRHLLEVSAGLDSLALGEKQILGQVKYAIKLSRESRMLGTRFNILTNLALRTGKKVQNETEISFGGMSVSWAAVRMAEKLLEGLAGKKVLIIGAGKMCALAGNQLSSRGTKEIYVMNRTREKAESLAEKISGTSVGFLDIHKILKQVDVGICALDAPHYILDREMAEKVAKARRGRPLYLIDISTPRNIDPEIQKLEGIHLFDIDDLRKVIDVNLSRRQEAIIEVQAIVDQKLGEYCKKITKIEANQTQAAIRL